VNIKKDIVSQKFKLIIALATIVLAALSVGDSSNLFYRLGTQLGLSMLFFLIGFEENRKPQKKYPYLYFLVGAIIFISLIATLVAQF